MKKLGANKTHGGEMQLSLPVNDHRKTLEDEDRPAAQPSAPLSECSGWTWIFLEPQGCINPKLPGE